MGDISKLNVGGTLYDIKDAKARTDVSDLKEDLGSLFYKNQIIEQGYYLGTDGSKGNSPNWCRTKNFIPLDYTIRTQSLTMYVAAFDQNGNYVGTWNWEEFSTSPWDGSGFLKVVDIGDFSSKFPTYKFKLTIYNAGSPVTPSDVYSDMLFENSCVSRNEMFPYFEMGGTVLWGKATGASFSLTVPSAVLYVWYKGNRYSITNSDLLTAAQTQGLTVQNNTISGDVIIFVFDTGSKTFAFRSSIQDADMVLFYGYWGSAVWGRLCDSYYYYNRQRIVLADYGLYGYIALGGQWEWNKNSYECNLKIPPRNVILKGTRIATEITINYNDIISALNASSLTTVTNSVVTGTSFSITYNIEKQTVGVHANNNYLPEEEIILFAHHWNSGDWGIMAQNGGYNGIDAVWMSHINQKVSDINNNMDAVGINGISFMFISDIHIENNDNYSHILAKHITDNTSIKYLVSGGDYITQSEDTSVAISDMRKCIDEFRESSRCFLPIVGNHDKNTNFAGSTYIDYEMTDNETFNSTQSLLPDKVVYQNYYYYYCDDEITKTRFILLSSGFEHYLGPVSLGSAQLSWAKSVMDNTPEGYHIIVFVHGIYQPSDWSLLTPTYDPAYLSADGGVLFDYVDDHNTSYPNAPVVAIFTGHIHIDMSTTTDDGVPVIWIDCDARNTGSGNYQQGTTNAQCFDGVTIDYTNKTIDCVRIGRGSDRHFTY